MKQMPELPKFEIIMYWSEADQTVISEVPELPGCAADGANYEQALKAVQIVMQEWLETASELGRELPKPRGRLMFA